jgi:hypothetical protein
MQMILGCRAPRRYYGINMRKCVDVARLLVG